MREEFASLSIDIVRQHAVVWCPMYKRMIHLVHLVCDIDAVAVRFSRARERAIVYMCVDVKCDGFMCKCNSLTTDNGHSPLRLHCPAFDFLISISLIKSLDHNNSSSSSGGDGTSSNDMDNTTSAISQLPFIDLTLLLCIVKTRCSTLNEMKSEAKWLGERAVIQQKVVQSIDGRDDWRWLVDDAVSCPFVCV